MNEEDDLILPSFKPDPNIFYHIFGRENPFDRKRDQERKIPKITDETFDRLNRSAKTQKQLHENISHPNPQRTKRPKVIPSKSGNDDVKAVLKSRSTSNNNDLRRSKIPKENLIPDHSPSCASTPLKRDVVYVIESKRERDTRDHSQDFITCVEERANRRKLNDYMKAHHKSSSQWDTEYQEPPKQRKSNPYLPSNPPKKDRIPIHLIDSSAPRSSILREQSVRQSLALREARDAVAEQNDAEYFDRIRQVNTEMTPYVKFVQDLEKPRDPGDRWSQKREENDRRMQSLKEIIDRTARATPLFLSNAKSVEAQSRLNHQKRNSKA